MHLTLFPCMLYRPWLASHYANCPHHGIPRVQQPAFLDSARALLVNACRAVRQLAAPAD